MTAEVADAQLTPAPLLSPAEYAVVHAFETAQNPLLEDLDFPLKPYGLVMQNGVAFQGYCDDQVTDRRDTDDLLAAQVVTSRCPPLADVFEWPDSGDMKDAAPPDGGWHYPVLDIDLPVFAIPSSTHGHTHLYVDRAMSWPKLVRLLDVLVEVGLVEKGYAEASKARGFTAVRLPWVSKDAPQTADELARIGRFPEGDPRNSALTDLL
jgi:hypothetical protein